MTRTEYEDRIEYDDGDIKVTLFKETPPRMVTEIVFGDNRLPECSTWQDAEADLVVRTTLFPE